VLVPHLVAAKRIGSYGLVALGLAGIALAILPFNCKTFWFVLECWFR